MLRDGKLLWQRTRWWPFHWMEKGPKYAEVELAGANVAAVGRQDPRWELLWSGGITNFVVGLFTGNLRECFGVRFKGANLWAYCFAVMDVDEWVTDIAEEEPMVELIGYD